MTEFQLSNHLISKVHESELEYIKYVTLNKNALRQSSECGCVYCYERYDPLEITDWCGDFDYQTNSWMNDTAICPYCGVDAVVPNSIIKYTDDDLKKWHKLGFSYD